MAGRANLPFTLDHLQRQQPLLVAHPPQGKDQGKERTPEKTTIPTVIETLPLPVSKATQEEAPSERQEQAKPEHEEEIGIYAAPEE